MAWDWNKTLSDLGESLSDVLKTEYATYKAKEAQPLIEETYNKMIFPLVIIGLVFLVIWKKM